MPNKEHANDHRQDNGDQLKPEMRYVLSAYQTDTLHHAANDQDPAKEQHHGDRGHNRIDQCENASEKHKSALNKIPKRMPLDRLPHCLAMAPAAASSDMVMAGLHQASRHRMCSLFLNSKYPASFEPSG